MTGRHDGTVAIVTGAGSGLGRASAIRLAAEGARVAVVDINGERATAVAAEIPGETIAITADVSVEADVDRYMRETVDAFGRVDSYHLNAGIFGSFAPLPDVAVPDFDAVMAVNVRGPFLGVRAAFRQFAVQDGAGSIVITASIASVRGSADLIPYHVSKHAVVGLVRSAAVYGGPLGIRVNGVAPGIVPTELFAGSGVATGGKDDMERRASTSPLRRAGRAEEIASVAAFLLSAEAAYVTGQVVLADGGSSVVNPARPSGGAGAWDVEGFDRRTYGEEDRS